MKNSIDCVDAGSENCPCYLALTDDCLICSRLQGKDCCDCNWKGVCIYNEFIQGNKRVNNPRKDFPAEIVKKKYYLDDLVAITLQVGKGFALKASRPGSYIFLRKEDSENFYETPLCVMAADIEKEQVTIAIKVISSKTKTIVEAEDRLMVRGVYRNGILGINEITDRDVKGKKILMVVKGIGLAPAMLTANYLWLKNRVDLVIDREKVSEDLIADYLGEGEGIIKYMNLADQIDQKELKDLLIRENYDTVIILASDHFIKLIAKMVKDTIPQAKLAVSNNFNICCGEGVCGACSVVNSKGQTFKMCKCQNVYLGDLL
ncbi:MAG: hypothetical protein GX076_01520 [Clostridiales bacterium]|nr:hypothetical protein [Clostridiales bacterium]